jgi:hypothetical protein
MTAAAAAGGSAAILVVLACRRQLEGEIPANLLMLPGLVAVDLKNNRVCRDSSLSLS